MTIPPTSNIEAMRTSHGQPAFIYPHVVSFEETNVVGNVYFTRHIAWQGRCRELFLKRHAPALLDEIARDLRLVTLRVSCEYFQELYALDEVEVCMSLAYLRQHRIGLDFNIMKSGCVKSVHASRGFQEIGCMRLGSGGLVTIPPPEALAEALRPYSTGRTYEATPTVASHGGRVMKGQANDGT